MRRWLAVLLFAGIFLSGCDQAALFDSLVSKEESQEAQSYVAKIAARDYAAIEEALDPAFHTADLSSRLEAMSKLLPVEAPKSVRVVGFESETSSTATRYNITLEYEYAASWLLATVLMERREGKLVLQGINLLPRSQSMDAENSFSFDGKGALHYVVFALTFAVPLLVAYALVLCIRTRFPKRKWLWILFVAVGWVQFNFNWSTGALNVQPLSLMLLGAGFLKAGPVAPWVLTFTLPLGAILFLARRRSFSHQEKTPPEGGVGDAGSSA
jgi:hypothetical protein